MLYINTKTRAIIDSPTPINGDNWIPTNSKKKESEIIAPKSIPVEKTSNDNAANAESDLTKGDIMQELDSFGVEYNKRATKKELLDILGTISEEV